MLGDVIKETSGSFVWGADATVVYYEKMDAAHRCVPVGSV
jgi:protease II